MFATLFFLLGVLGGTYFPGEEKGGEKWSVCSPTMTSTRAKRSRTRNYIGAITDIPAIRAGRGECSTQEE